MIPSKLISALLMALLLGFATVSQAAAPRDPYKHFFTETFGDLTEDLETAKDDGKKAVFVFFEMDQCPWCHRMKTTILNQPGVQDYFREHFHNISIDIQGDTELVDFAGNETTMKDWSEQKMRVRATPVMAFFDLEGNRMVRFTSASSSVKEFMWLGEYVVTDAYKQLRWGKYKRARKAHEKKTGQAQ